MLWKIKKIPVMYIVLIVLAVALLLYMFKNYKVDDVVDNSSQDNQLSVLGASSIPFIAPSDKAITTNQKYQSIGPQVPTPRPSNTPVPTVSPSPTPTSSPTDTPTPPPTSTPPPPPPPPNPPPPPAEPPPPPVTPPPPVEP